MFSLRWGDWEKGRDGKDKKFGAYYRFNVPVRHSGNNVREAIGQVSLAAEEEARVEMQFGPQPLEMAFAIMGVSETPRTVFVKLSDSFRPPI